MKELELTTKEAVTYLKENADNSHILAIISTFFCIMPCYFIGLMANVKL